jgi:hypothetical protein
MALVMPSRIVGLILIVAALLAVQERGAVATQPSIAWERAIAAKGGRDALRRVRSVLRSDVLTRRAGIFRRVDSRFVTLLVLPNRLWEWADERPFVWGLSLSVIDTNVGSWFYLPGPDVVKHLSAGPDQMAKIRSLQAITLMEAEGFLPRVTGERRTRRSVVVEAELGLQQFEFHLSSDTNLPSLVVDRTTSARGATVVHRYRLSDYRMVDGVCLPHVIEDSSTFTYRYRAEYQLNVAYDETAFTSPRLTSDPQSWQAR